MHGLETPHKPISLKTSFDQYDVAAPMRMVIIRCGGAFVLVGGPVFKTGAAS